MMFGLFKRDPLKEEAEAIFAAIADSSRLPALFRYHGVPDTVEGRFESLAMHVFLVVRQLDKLGPDGKALAQHLIDRFFANLDDAMRAIGIGDTSVGKKVKSYARNFYGRVEAYSAGLQGQTPDILEDAVRRNLLGAQPALAPKAPVLAAYMRASADRIGRLDLVGLRRAINLFATDTLP